MKKILKKAAAGLCAAAMLCGSALPALPEEISLLAPALTASAAEKIRVGEWYSPGDTIDFGNGAYYICDDADDGYLAHQSGTCKLTLSYYDDEYSQYLFKLGTSDLWISSEPYLKVHFIRVTGGDGTENSPYRFAVQGEVDSYCFSVAGTEVTNFNKDDILKNGIFSYDPDTQTLFVKGDYTNTKDCPLIAVGYYWDSVYNDSLDYSIFDSVPLTINVTTDSVLCGSKGIYIDAVYYEGGTFNTLQVTLTGEGKLNLNTTEYGVMTNYSAVDVIDADVTITSHYGIKEEDWWGGAMTNSPTCISRTLALRSMQTTHWISMDISL